jgi:hypothetical protein
MSVTTKPRPSSVVEKFAGGSFNNTENERPESFERARPRSRENVAVDFALSTGRRRAFEYAYLMEHDYEPGDTIHLYFANATGSIEGRNLEALYDLLLEHRVRSVNEGGEDGSARVPEDAEHVDRIMIEEAKQGL